MSEASKPQVNVLILDLDNTLWDWADVWVKSFTALLSELTKATGIDPESLKREIREVHQRRGTTEYSFLLDELPSLQPFLSGTTSRVKFDDALHAQNSIRKHQTRLYPGVLHTLISLKGRGVKLIGYTESLSYWSEWRIRTTGLDGVLDVLYSAPDHDFPTGITPKQVRTLKKSEYGLKKTEHRHTPKGVLKPDSQVLERIVAEFGLGASGIAYVGDNLSKDIVMAQSVGVHDVHAAYGEAHNRDGYELLREVTHWTPEMVDKERDSRPGALPRPSYVLENRFDEILEIFDFGSLEQANSHIELWKKSVDVQQHFNDIGWRIRALALTAMTFALGATGYAYFNAPVSADARNLVWVIPAVGAALWASFMFMDIAWFHRLLTGAVRDGLRLERILNALNVRADLAGAIGRASPIRFSWLKLELHSRGKLWLFYILGLAVLISVAFLVVCVPPTVA